MEDRISRIRNIRCNIAENRLKYKNMISCNKVHQNSGSKIFKTKLYINEQKLWKLDSLRACSVTKRQKLGKEKLKIALELHELQSSNFCRGQNED